MKIMHIQYQGIICTSIKKTAGNADLNYGGGSDVDARSRGHDDWYDED